jgi:cell division protein FtsW (lipid II flippase)
VTPGLQPEASGLSAFAAILRRMVRGLSRPRGFGSLVRTAAALAPALLVLVLSAWWACAMRAAIDTGNGQTTLDRLTIVLPASGKSIAIGRAELAQPVGAESAADGHIGLARDGVGGVTIANVAGTRKLEVGPPGATTRDADVLTLDPGVTVAVTIGRRRLVLSNVAVAAAGAGSLALETIEAGATTRYAVVTRGRAVTVTRTEPGPPATFGDCPSRGLTTWRERGERLVADLFGAGSQQITALVISSGGDSCRVGWTVYVPFRPVEADGGTVARGSAELHLLWDSARRRFALKLGRDAELERNAIRVTEIRDGRVVPREPLRGIAWPVAPCPGHAVAARPDAVGSFVAGRGRYGICSQPGGDLVEIRAEAKGALYAFETCADAIGDGATGSQERTGPRSCPTAVPAGKAVTREMTVPANLFDPSRTGPLRGLSVDKRRSEAIARIAVFALCGLVAAVLGFRAVAAARREGTMPPAATLLAPLALLFSTALAAAPEIAGTLGHSPTARGMWLATIADWAFAGLVLATIRRSGAIVALVWAMFTGLAAVGTVSLTTLVVDLGNTEAIEYIAKHKLVFVDLLPPLAVALAMIPERWPREAIAGFLLGNRLVGGRQGPAGMALPWLANFIAFSGLLAWAAFGTQQGLLGFLQPVEFGKYWAIVLVAALFATFERGTRRLAPRSARWISAVSILLVVFFVALLAIAPVVRSDYSPLVVVVAAIAVMLGFRLADILRWIRMEGRRIDASSRLPRRFAPRITRRLPWPLPQWRIDRGRAWFISALVQLAGVVVIAWLVASYTEPVFATRVLELENGWPAERECRIAALVAARGKGRNVPVERFLTWDDLDYAIIDRPQTPTTCPATAVPSEGDRRPPALAIRFPELSYQVVRSRSEIAAAPCPASDVMKGGGTRLGGFDPAVVVSTVGSATAWLLGLRLEPADVLCWPLAAGDTGSDAGERSAVLDIRGPATIPVVSNDFAGAYLVARHGIQSAMMLLGFQMGLVSLAVLIYVRLQWPHSGDRREAVVRYFVSLLAVGSAALFGVQWLFAWSNVLGLLPVMGQPMTWLSYATSHHLLMALPAALTLLLAARLSGGNRPRAALRAPPRRGG